MQLSFMSIKHRRLEKRAADNKRWYVPGEGTYRLFCCQGFISWINGNIFLSLEPVQIRTIQGMSL